MPFNSFSYLAFLAASVTVYWLLPVRLRRTFVLLASLAFYATWSVAFLAIPLLVSGVVYLVSRWMCAAPASAKQRMWAGIGTLLVILVFFKYRDFALDNLNALLVWMSARPRGFARTVAMPVGISFYTFEAIGYLIDVRQGRVKALPGFLDLCLFFLFWPNVTSGPIVRARELFPQLGFRAPFEPRFVFEGIDRIIWGLIQKTVIANTLGVWVNEGFSKTAIPSTVDAWAVAIAFGLQIYFDFAGYSNMAIGAARLLGVHLPENFRQPYHAATPAEFWARWHLSLSRWIRDYLFFPINAKYKGAPLSLYCSLLGVMAAVGLWHGADWNFVLWGAMHGLYLILFRVYENARNTMPALTRSRLASVGWRVLTLIGVTAAWVPFRAPNLRTAGAVLSGMFIRPGMVMTYNTTFYLFIAAVIAFCAVEPLLARKFEDGETSESRGLAWTRVLGRPLVYTCGLLLFMMFDQHDAQFIYFQF
jgi:D-alanyl-lipoteichoic acid acyltransferase DltB (MBOAT superfamily)